MFLTQLAAIAMRRSGVATPPLSENEWNTLIVGMTDRAREPWCLVVDDMSKPAFFQPPVPEGDVSGWKEVETPDGLDLLVTAKSHDVKTCLINASDAEAWAYAICSVQTMQGYPGRGYNGISRMNGGYGNRPRVGLSPSLAMGERFLRDVTVLLDEWPALLTRGFRDDGVALVWCLPWDGSESFALNALSPHFIEICQRLRIIFDNGALTGRRTTSSARRCAPEVQHGDVGDPWCPIERESAEALTVGPRGYDYRLLVDVLFANRFAPGAAQRVRTSDSDGLLLWVNALARGQGKTEGLHERILPLSSVVQRRLLAREQQQGLGQRARDRVQRAEEMRSKVLFPAIRLLALGEALPEGRFEARVDECFFHALFGSADWADDIARRDWEDRLLRIAESELNRAIERVPLSDAVRWRAVTSATRVLWGCMKKRFPDAFERRRGPFETTATEAESA
ncbi:MAG: type I-E CRISPR-associated protein Cse1/CasA [Planctomycetes bacterium]|nr:type I-E CRISPR-associated protein Cse1/CasA [Planctomycetota bacterium]